MTHPLKNIPTTYVFLNYSYNIIYFLEIVLFKSNNADTLVREDEARTRLLNGVSVSDTRIGHRHSYGTCRTRIVKVFN